MRIDEARRHVCVLEPEHLQLRLHLESGKSADRQNPVVFAEHGSVLHPVIRRNQVVGDKEPANPFFHIIPHQEIKRVLQIIYA